MDRTGRPEHKGGGGYCYEMEISGSGSTFSAWKTLLNVGCTVLLCASMLKSY